MPMRKEESTQPIYEQVEAIYRSESRLVFATLIRLLGDFDLAQEAVQTAFAAALEQWPREGAGQSARVAGFHGEIQSDRRVAAEGATEFFHDGIDGAARSKP